MKGKLAIIFLTLAAVAFARKKCLKPTAVPVDDEWLEQTGKFYIPIHSGCDNCEKGDKEWSGMDGRGVMKTRCWHVGIDRKDGSSFNANFRCKYTSPEVENCELMRKDPPFLAGSMIIFKTDNSSYIAGATCVYGKENFWWIATVQKSLEQQLEDEILDDIGNLGFRSRRIAKPGESIIILRNFTIFSGSCDKKV